ncbi:S9 family peptidase [Sinomonas sp. ASV322]|uniref:S9 family peptidase n=1 Tax=Sinomonas sp. ASV322 TaxID=3041920 RepID=UPI0027DD2A33|nr:S9 family peptidase [Sinomonas sp. ASV322]MDQ4501639.1 S9 family peptidase [Sinomonas sp. ASV322]
MNEALAPAPAGQAAAVPPVAKKVPTFREHHGDTFADQYEWLRDKESPEVVAHLEAENAYTEAVTADQQPLRDAIFAEIKGRTQETDLSVPSRLGDWWYYSRTIEDKQYPVYCRVAAEGAPAGAQSGAALESWTPPTVVAGAAVPGEQVLLDGNAEAEGKPFFALGGATVSRDGILYAYTVDNTGDESFALRIKDLGVGQQLPDVIEHVFYGLEFSTDGRRLYYVVADESWRPHQIRVHTLGTPAEQDEVLFEERDVAQWTSLDLSSDRRWLLVSIGNSEYSETRYLDLEDPDARLELLIGRGERILHAADIFEHDGAAHVLLAHNRDPQGAKAVNSMVSVARLAEFAKPLADQQWLTIVAHDDAVKIESAEVTSSHLVVSLRRDTIETVRFAPLAEALAALDSAADGHPAPSFAEPAFGEELYTAGASVSDYRAPVARLSYTSYFTPPRVYDYVLATGELILRKETPVLGGYDPADYVAERAWATADDGTRVPLSVLRRASVLPDGTNPALVYGYGSYEVSMDPGFAIPRLSLLDRGVVFVVAHIRGGGELGRRWYEDGKKLRKKNTFTDFVAAADWVAASGWGDPSRLACMGGSAGGLLIGAVLNLAPERFAAAVAQVPFVDALTTILDPELPLSALEWEEWGNPIEDADVYAYMKSYTPYENVRPAGYPAVAAVTSFNDTRVLYVEPAKWVQVLREASTSSRPIVLKTEMDAGHGGASGRYEAWKDRAWDYAFIADALGARELLA